MRWWTLELPVGTNHDGSLGPDVRLIELAAILTVGITRLHLSAQRANLGHVAPTPPESGDFSPTVVPLPLERSHATGVTVHTGVNGGESGVLEPEFALFNQEVSTWL